MQTQYFNGVVAYLYTVRENVNAVVRCVRVHILGRT